MSEIGDALSGVGKNTSEEKKIAAVGALFTLATDDETRKEILDSGGVELVIDCLKTSKNKDLLKSACGALLNLAIDGDCREEIHAQGGTEILFKLSDPQQSYGEKVVEYASGAICNMANDEQTREFFRNNKQYIPIFYKFLQSDSDELIKNALGAFTAIAIEENLAEEIQKQDEFKSVVKHLDHEDIDIQVRASGIIWNLSVSGDKTRQALGDAGAVERLDSLLDHDDPELLANATICVSILGSSEQNAQRFRELDGFSKIVKLLEHDDEQVQQNAATAVWNFSHDENNRKLLIDKGALKHLIPLLESEVDDCVERTLGAILTLCMNEEASIQFRELEGLEKLNPLMEDPDQEKKTLYTLITIGILAYEKGNKDALRESGALARLIEFLSSENDKYLEKTSGGILNMTLNKANRTAMRQLDGIAPLIELLFHPNPSIQQNAAGALWNLSMDEANKTVIRKLGGLQPLLTLIGGGKVDPKSKTDRQISEDKLRDALNEAEQDKEEEDESKPDDDEEIDIDAPNVQLDGMERKKAGFGYGEYGPETDMGSPGTFIVGAGRFNLKKRKLQIEKEKEMEKEKERKEQEEKDRIERERRRKEREEKERIEKEKREQERIQREKEEEERRKKEEEEEKKRQEEERKKKEEEEKRRQEEERKKKLAKKLLVDAPNLDNVDLDDTDNLYAFEQSRSKQDAIDNLKAASNAYRDLLLNNSELANSLSPDEKKMIDQATKELLDYLENNPDVSIEELDRKRRNLDKLLQPFVIRAEKRKEIVNDAKDKKNRMNEDIELASHITPEDKKTIDDAVTTFVETVQKNPRFTIKELDKKKQELDSIVDPIISKAEKMKGLSFKVRDLRDTKTDPVLSKELSELDKKELEKQAETLEDFVANNKGATEEEINDVETKVDEIVRPIMLRAKTRADIRDKVISLSLRTQNAKNLSPEEKKDIEDEIKTVVDFLDKNPVATLNHIREKGDQLDDIKSILDKQDVIDKIEDRAKRIQFKLRNDKQISNHLKPEDRRKVEEVSSQIVDWIKRNPQPSESELEEKKSELDSIQPLIDVAEARNGFNRFAVNIRDSLNNDANLSKLSPQEKKRIDEILNEGDDWLSKNDPTISQIEEKKKEIELKLRPIIAAAQERKIAKDYANQLRNGLNDKDDKIMSKLTPLEKNAIDSATKELLDWLENNPNCTPIEVREKRAQMDEKIDKALSRVRGLQGLNGYLDDVENKFVNGGDSLFGSALTKQDKNAIRQAIDNTREYLEQNPSISEKDIEKQKSKVAEVLKPIVDRINEMKNLRDVASRIRTQYLDDPSTNRLMSENEKKIVDGALNDLETWITNNPNAPGEEISQQKKKFENTIEPVRKIVESRRNLQSHARDLKNKISDDGTLAGMRPEEKKIIDQSASEALQFVEKNPSSIDEIEKKMNDLTSKTLPLIEKYREREELRDYVKNLRDRMTSDPTLATGLTAEERRRLDESVNEILDLLETQDLTKQKMDQLKQSFDRKAKETLDLAQARGDAIQYANNIRDTIRDNDKLGGHLSDADKKLIESQIDELLDWIEQNPNASPTDVEKKMKELKKKIDPLLEAATAKSNLEKWASKTRERIENDDKLNRSLTDYEKRLIDDLIQEGLQYLEEQPNNADEINEKLQKLKDKSQSTIDKADIRANIRDQAKRAKQARDELADNLSDQEKLRLDSAIHEALDWIDSNPSASKEELQRRLKDLKEKTDPILEKVNTIKGLQDKAKNIREALQSDSRLDRLTDDERKLLDNVCDEILDWCQNPDNAKVQDIAEKRRKLETANEIMNAAKARSKLADDIGVLRNRIHSPDDRLTSKLTNEERKLIENALDGIEDWLEKNPNATKEEIDRRREILNNAIAPLLSKSGKLGDLEKSLKKLRRDIHDENGLAPFLSDEEKRMIDKHAVELLDWIDKNPNASKDDIQKMLDQFNNQTKDVLEKAKAKQKLNDYARNLRNALKDEDRLADNLSNHDKNLIENAIMEALDYLDENRKATTSDLGSALRDLENKVKPILGKGNAKNNLRDYVYNLRKRIDNDNELASTLSNQDKRKIIDKTNAILDWIDSHDNCSPEDILQKRQELEELVNPIFSKATDKQQLREKMNSLRNKLKDDSSLKSKIPQKDREIVENAIDELLDYLDSHPDLSATDVENKYNEFKDKVMPILNKAEAKNELEKKAKSLRSRLKDKEDPLSKYLTSDEKKMIDECAMEVLDFLDKNPDADVHTLNEKLRDLESKTQAPVNRAEKFAKARDYAKKMKDDTNLDKGMRKKDRDLINQSTQEFLDWIDGHPNATIHELERKKEELDNKIKPIISKNEAKKELSEHLRNMRSKIQNDDNLSKNLGKDRALVDSIINEALDFIDNKADNLNDISEKRREVDGKIQPILAKAEAKRQLNEYIENLKNRLSDSDDSLAKMKPEEKKKVQDALSKAEKFLRDNPNVSHNEIQDVLKNLEKEVSPIVNRYGARDDIEDYVDNMKKRIGSDKKLNDKISEENKKKIQHALKDVEEWLKENPNANREQVKLKKVELKGKIDPILRAAEKASDLEEYAKGVQKRIKSDPTVKNKLTREEKKRIEQKSQEIVDWVENNKNATEKEIESRKKELSDFVDPVISQAQERSDLQDYAKEVQRIMNSSKILQRSMTNEEKQAVDDYTREILDWIKQNPNATPAQFRFQKNKLEQNLKKVKNFKFDVPDASYVGFRFQESMRWGDMSKRTKEFYYGSYLKQEQRRKGNVDSKSKSSDPVSSPVKLKLNIKKSAPKSVSSEDAELLKLFDKMKSTMISPMVQAKMSSLADTGTRVPGVNTPTDSSPAGDSSKSMLEETPVILDSNATFSYEQLKNKPGRTPPRGIDLSKRETYLTDAEFQQLFKMDKDKFKSLPQWKKVQLKKQLDLF